MISFAGRGVLFVLLGVFVLSNAAAIALGAPDAARTRRSIPWLQRSTSLQLAVTAWLFWLLGARGTALSTFSILIASGMTVSFVADLIMAEIGRGPKVGMRVAGRTSAIDPGVAPGLPRGRKGVLAGMAFFGLAHVVYTLAYLSGGQALGPLSASAWAICIVLMGAVSAGLWDRVVRSARAGPVMNGAALGYSLIVGVMVAAAVAVSSREARLWLLPLGATLFMASDIILGNQIFRSPNWPYVYEAVWLAYIAGQACIVWSNYQALAVLGGA